MNFYHAYYKRQVYNKDRDCWEDTCYNCQGIIVLANDYDEAEEKVKKCLPIVETEKEYGKYRAVLVGDIVECIGLDRRHGFDGSFEVYPIDLKRQSYMVYKEEVRDLFAVPEEYYLAHCISADFGMGKGIAIEFNKRFDTKRKLQIKYPDYRDEWRRNNRRGDCILEGRVFNLITKERYFHKPTYESLRSALLVCRSECIDNGITKIAMPIIGCGLDKLQWNKVSEIIKEIFGDTEIEILVCRQ